jgi:dipeptidyl aminopeptidase/acylaminoacyl peptidase
MGIFQRRLEDFNEKPVILNRQTSDNCMNCHNFWQNGTDQWLLHLRGGPGTAMLLVLNGEVRNIITKTKFNAPAAYPAWHPSGKIIAFSCSNLLQFFHTTGECRDVLDRASDLIVYDISSNTITSTPQISNPERMEIWPAWSPDGKFLYFCSAPKIETFVNPANSNEFAYDRIKYDLMRIAYDPDNRSWGKVDTVISAAEFGLSITEPRVSPDGRYVLFTATTYSQFPIYLPSADLYLLDLRTGQWKKSEANSERADSFHSWSSNGRWIVFSSKRQDGLFTRPYFTYFDSLGIVSKPFVLPQKNPELDESSLQIYNVPEFTVEPIRELPQDLARAAFAGPRSLAAKLDPAITAKPKPAAQETKSPLTKTN